jgi:hypothetical protein
MMSLESTHLPAPISPFNTGGTNVFPLSYTGFIRGILRGVRYAKSLRVLFLHRRSPSWTILVLYSRVVFIFNEPNSSLSPLWSPLSVSVDIAVFLHRETLFPVHIILQTAESVLVFFSKCTKIMGKNLHGKKVWDAPCGDGTYMTTDLCEISERLTTCQQFSLALSHSSQPETHKIIKGRTVSKSSH